ncbi:hypothetical protein H2200_003430 [Cladophialophora chaetospira]|uniref:Uncharacterized protein n=1 Tax=Cladophialophora chaetospira TaxID=386627 RepID=A0AA39CMR0_9EURO|nr:hypothetical protein H2200_003430 [Cladophialophora chaetospira]
MVFLTLSFLPAASAQSSTNSPTPLYVPSSFIVNPHATAPPNKDLFTPLYYTTNETEDAVNQESGWFYLLEWDKRGEQIRYGHGNRECLGNLSLALAAVGNLNAAEYSGASGALSLLPTAGALIGAPAKELWIVYKLMPIAGVLSMLLSLGGTITPSDSQDYDVSKGLRFGGLMRSRQKPDDKPQEKGDNGRAGSPRLERKPVPMSKEQAFAEKVFQRAQDDSGNSYARAWIGVGLQMIFFTAIMTTMWYAQKGGVITWWCQVWGWMYFWYFLVIITSIFENYVSQPFSSSWTMRVSRAPTNINISESASRIVDKDKDPQVLNRLRRGVNTRTRLSRTGNGTHDWSGSCFYVVVSIEGTTGLKAALSAISKGCSISVFAFGTALFASSTLMSISAVLMVLAVTLSCGVMGRVVAMWIASVMTENSEPMLHQIVKDEDQASLYMEEILAKKGLLIEIMSHVIMNGQVIRRQSQWFSPATYIGLLAPPVPVHKLAYDELRSSSSSQLDGTKPGFEVQQMIVPASNGSFGSSRGPSDYISTAV